jgi:hypothetical protein
MTRIVPGAFEQSLTPRVQLARRHAGFGRGEHLPEHVRNDLADAPQRHDIVFGFIERRAIARPSQDRAGL